VNPAKSRWIRAGLTTALVFLFIPLLVQAQTSTDDSSGQSTNTPAFTAPAVPDSATSPQIAPSSIPGTDSTQDKLEDIRPPIFFLHSWLWLWILLGLAALIALIVLLWIWLRPHRMLSPKSAYELALEKLEKARALLREDQPMPYAVFVSETIRSYLGQRFQAPSTRRTTEEFLRQMQGDPNTPLAEHRDLLRSFLQSCDMVKFARYQPTLAELEQVQQNATSFVIATKPLPETAQRNGK